MKKLFAILSLVALVAVFGISQASAQSPSSKFTAIVSNVALVPPTESQEWKTVLDTWIKTPNKKDLLVGGSFETALYTATVVKASGNQADTSSAAATLDVRLLIDGEPSYAYPGEVTYDKRIQTLSARLGGELAQCVDSSGDGVIDPVTECPLTLEIGLILDTMAAHHYNFVVPDMPSGIHTVEIQVRIDTQTAFTAGSARAWAAVGRGSLTVEEVHSRNTEDGIEFVN